MFSAPIVHGNSGGPMFNGNGEVIGIATLGREDALAMNYAIPVSAVNAFIEQAKAKEEVKVALENRQIINATFHADNLKFDK